MELKPSYKQTEVGVIPQDWAVKPLLAAVSIATGQADPKVEPYKSMILVAPDHIESSTGRLIAKETAAEQGAISGKYLFKPGDIVYSKIRPYLRKAILADFAGLCSADMYPLKPAPQVVPGFILAVILDYRFSKYAESVSARSGIPKINRAELGEFSLPLPTLAEQEAIAGALSDADGLIESLEQLIAKKRQIKQGAMQELLTGQKRLPGFSGPWEVKRLGDIAKCFSGGTPATNIVSYYSGDIPWITSSDLNKGYITHVAGRISEAGLENSAAKMIEANTLLMALYGATSGVTAISRLRAAINQAVLAIVPQREDKYFLFFRLRSLKEQLVATYTQGGQPNLSGDIVKALEIAIPSLPEQTAIAEILTDMDAELVALEARLAKTRQLKQGMMQELLTGKTRLL